MKGRRYVYGLLLWLLFSVFWSGSVLGGYDPDAFVTKWKATGSSIEIRFSGASHVQVRAYLVSATPPSTFQSVPTSPNWKFSTTKDAEYIVEAKGMTSLNVISVTALQKIEQWGTTQWTSLAEAFKNCVNLTIPSTAGHPILTHCGSINFIFLGCSKLEMLNAKDWDVKKVRGFYRAFYGCSQLKDDGFKDWKLESATDIREMFFGCGYFKVDMSGWKDYILRLNSLAGVFSGCSIFEGTGLEDWKVDNVLSFESTFAGCEKFKGDLSKWNTSKARNMKSMFSGNKEFNADITKWKVKNVVSFDYMFFGCEVFNQNLNAWLDPADPLGINNAGGNAAQGMEAMFQKCTNFNMPLDKWDVSGVTSMGRMFSNCISFNQKLNTWTVSNVKNMLGMFEGASTFNKDLSSWTLSNVTTMQKMFFDAQNFNQDMSGWAGKTSKVRDFSEMFNRAKKFEGKGLEDWDVSQGANFRAMFHEVGPIFQGKLSKWKVGNATDMSLMFKDCSEFNADLSRWRPVQVTTTESMFLGCSNFNSPLSEWRMPNNLNMSQMFYGCSKFNQPIGDWDVREVRNFSSMFYKAAKFNQDLKNWNTANGDNFSSMFGNATDFAGDLSKWNVGNAINMSRMFYAATNFKSDLSQWDVSNVTDMTSMFDAAYVFNSDLTKWNVGKVKSMKNMFASAREFDCSLGGWDLSSLNGELTLRGSGIGIANYDRSLIGWAEKGISGITVDASATPPKTALCYYSDEADAAHTKLVDPAQLNWTIIDGGRKNIKKIELVPRYSIVLDEGKTYNGIEDLEIPVLSGTPKKWELQLSQNGGAPTKYSFYNAIWKSLDPSIVKVSVDKTAQTFKLEALKVGHTTIRVSISNDDRVYDELMVDVVVLVSSLNINSSYDLPLGHSLDLRKELTIEPANASNKKLEWVSDHPEIVSVDKETGIITAHTTEGTAKITVTCLDRPESDGRVSKQITIHAKRVPVSKLEVFPAAISLIPGGKTTLTVDIQPETATDKAVTWSSSKGSVVAVDPATGAVTVSESIVEGDIVYVTAKHANGMTSTCKVTVLRKGVIIPSGITLLPKTMELYINETQMLRYSIEPATTEYKSVDWKSMNPDIVSVKDGRVRGLAKGTAEVRVYSRTNPQLFDMMEVTVKELAVLGIEINKDVPNYEKGATEETSFFKIPKDVPSTIPYFIKPSAASDKSVSYDTEGSADVVVEKGMLVGKNVGKIVKVKVTANGGSNQYAYCYVKVVEDKKPTKLLLSKHLSVHPRATGTFNLGFEPEDVTDRLVKWESDDTEVFKVSQDGSYEAVQAGYAVVTVSLISSLGQTPEIKAQCHINVLPYTPVTGLEMIAQVKIAKGKFYTFSPKITPVDATDKALVWRVTEGGDKIRLDSESGTIEGIAVGTAKVEVSLRSKPSIKAVCDVTVAATMPTLKENTIAFGNPSQFVGGKRTLEVKVGKEQPVEITYEETGATPPAMRYVSEDPTYVLAYASSTDLNKVVIYGRRATDNDRPVKVRGYYKENTWIELSVTVTTESSTATDPAPLTFGVFSSQLRLLKGSTGFIPLKDVPNGCDIKKLDWTSSNQSVCEVTPDGGVKALGVGTSTITIKNSNPGGSSCQVNVEVIDPDEVVKLTNFGLEKDEMTLVEGNSGIPAFTGLQPTNGKISSLKHSIDIAGVCSWDSNTGVVKAIAKGEATITFTTADDLCTHTLKVKVIENPVTPSVEEVTDFDAPTEITLVEGNTVKIELTNLQPSPNASTDALVWESVDHLVCDVNKGFVKANTVGNTTIKVGKSGAQEADKKKIQVTVLPKNGGGIVTPSKPLEKFEAPENPVSVTVGNTNLVKLKLTPTDGDTSKLKWSSANSAVASVNDKGEVTGVAGGETTITVTDENGNNPISFTVKVVDPASAPVDPTKELKNFTVPDKTVSVVKDNETTIKLGTDPADADTSHLQWSSDKESVATVVNGVVKGVGVGDATISVFDPKTNITKQFTVKVVAAPKPELNSFDVPENPVSVVKNNETTVKLGTDPTDADTSKLEWSSSDESIAKVENGVIKGVGTGEATITVRDPKTGTTKTFKVNVVSGQENGATPKPELKDFEAPDKPVSVVENNETVIKLKTDPENADTSRLQWSSGDESVAKVENGVVKGVGTGSTTITVYDPVSKKTVTFNINVVSSNGGGSGNKPELESFELEQSELYVVQYYQALVPLKVTPEGADISRLQWEIEDQSICEVKDGVIKGLSVGKTTVKVTDYKTRTEYTLEVVVIQSTSVEDAILSQVTVTPNPFSSNFRIFDEKSSVDSYALINVNGQVLRAGKTSDTETVVEAANLPAGLYFLQLKTVNGVARTVRLMKR